MGRLARSRGRRFAIVAVASMVPFSLPASLAWAGDDPADEERAEQAARLFEYKGKVIDACDLVDGAAIGSTIGIALDEQPPPVSRVGRSRAPGAGTCAYSNFFSVTGTDPATPAEEVVESIESGAVDFNAITYVTVAVASTDSLRGALGKPKVTTRTRFDDLLDGAEATRALKEEQVATQEAQGALGGAPPEFARDIATASFVVTDVPGVGERAFARIPACTHSLTVVQEPFLLDVVLDPPRESQGNCLVENVRNAQPQVLATVLQPLAQQALERLAEPPAKKGRDPEVPSESISVELGGKQRNVCSVLKAKEAESVLGFEAMTFGSSFEAGEGRHGGKQCIYGAVDSVFGGALFVAFSTSETIAADLGDPALTARSRLDALQVEENDAAAMFGFPPPPPLEPIGDAAFFGQVHFRDTMFVASGDVLLELTYTEGDLEDLGPDRRAAIMDILSGAAQKVVARLQALN